MSSAELQPRDCKSFPFEGKGADESDDLLKVSCLSKPLEDGL